jgi:hypothetical protein
MYRNANLQRDGRDKQQPLLRHDTGAEESRDDDDDDDDDDEGSDRVWDP